MSGTKTYAIDKGFAALMRASPWIFVAFVALGVALPFLPDDGRPGNPTVVLGLSAFSVLFSELWAGGPGASQENYRNRLLP
jgi:hypothetical protein